ncbi:5-oxoprolinase subunit PxpB [Verminephrobacter eiseniae]|uniref:5-oxoprolinase subunit PxpB n=1 Tax=Verminephrobacter eiseniae TaxID=364317 RepID=UPI0038B28797|nr:5-oxoprolinase subunit PxpB [Verminephrobacter eiseniae]
MSMATQKIDWRIVASGDSCLVVEIRTAPAAGRIDPVLASQWAGAAATALRQAGLPGVTDVVPAMVSVGVHYRPQALQSLALPGESSYQAAARVVAALLEPLEWQEAQAARVVEVPVCYGGEHGPDLASVAAACGLSPQGLIDLHAGAQVRVLMMGFAPGLPYIGSFDTRLAVPRRPQPRMAVPGGSIGLANRQSVIYPFTLPGGWSLIGRTPMQLFDPNRDPACLLQAGDGLRFVPISAATFGALAGAR